MFEGFAAGLSLGLATGIACLASCGPIYGAYLLGERRTGLQSLWVILQLNIGRFIAYATFGAIIGMVGGVIPPNIRIPVALSGYLLFSIYLILSVVRVRRTCSGCQTGTILRITRSPFILGILTGFSICPAFLIALTSAFKSSGPISGMLLFIGFFVGTSVYMLPFALFGILTMKDWITKAARMIAVVVAIYFAAIGIRGLAQWMSQSHPTADLSDQVLERSDADQSSDASIFSIEDADTLYVLSFTEDEIDRGADIAADIDPVDLPPISLIEINRDSWRADIGALPRLAAVLAPLWLDDRAEVPTTPWQDSLSDALQDMQLRIFAIEYEPYCSDRVTGVKSFLERYSFRCHPDSGFTFLMLNPLGCQPADCSTCDFSH